MIQIELTIKNKAKVIKVVQLVIEEEQDVEHQRYKESLDAQSRKMYDELPAGLPDVRKMEVEL